MARGISQTDADLGQIWAKSTIGSKRIERNEIPFNGADKVRLRIAYILAYGGHGHGLLVQQNMLSFTAPTGSGDVHTQRSNQYSLVGPRSSSNLNEICVPMKVDRCENGRHLQPFTRDLNLYRLSASAGGCFRGPFDRNRQLLPACYRVRG